MKMDTEDDEVEIVQDDDPQEGTSSKRRKIDHSDVEDEDLIMLDDP